MEYLEYQYKEVSTDPDFTPDWSNIHRNQPDDEAIFIDGLTQGTKYDVRARYYDDDDDTYSPWVVKYNVTADVPRANPPPAPIEVRQTSGGCLSWRLPAVESPDAPRVIGYEIRHALGIWDNYLVMEKAHEGLVLGSPWNLCEVPGGLRTISIQSVNVYGVKSDPTYVTIKTRELDDAAKYTSTVSYPMRTGLHSVQGGTLNAGQNGLQELQAQTIGAADDCPFWPSDTEPFWGPAVTTLPIWTDDEAPFWDVFLGGNFPFWQKDDTQGFWAANYQSVISIFNVYVDEAQSGPSKRLSMGVNVPQNEPNMQQTYNAPVRIEYRMVSGGLGAYDPGAFWVENTYSSFWTADADEFWTVSEEPFRPWPGRIEGLQPGWYQFRITSLGGHEQACINDPNWRLSSAEREELFSLQTIPVNGTRIKPDTQFGMIEQVQIQYLAETPDGVTVFIDDKDRTNGPALVARDANGDPVTATVEVILKGY